MDGDTLGNALTTAQRAHKRIKAGQKEYFVRVSGKL